MMFDAYLAHAAENADAAEELAAALGRRGLKVWFNSFIAGPSIREQMEWGLREADFGIVLLSSEFFAKKWTRLELDALMGLEEPGEVRILPVWWHTGAAEVRQHSPMIAMRSAVVLGEGGMEASADALVKSILYLSSHKSPATHRRHQIATGFPWLDGCPLWLPNSLREYDRKFVDEYSPATLSHYPNIEEALPSHPLPLTELVRAHTFWDGRRITTIGRQVPGSVQVLEQLVPAETLPPNPTRPSDACLAAYVFRLTSVDFAKGELCYVHCVGPYSDSVPGMGPNAPHDGWLCWVTGLLLAFGHMLNARREAVPAIYLVASSLVFTPPVDTGAASTRVAP